ncbi:MAG TPA: PDZ domain-containing protein [Terriglobales bacterium]|nr:PDZ domain-containing protein [Terriglobales bacterium]
MKNHTFFGLAALVACFYSSAFAADHVHYNISLVDPGKHLVQVAITIPPGKSERELQLPVWNALYQVRDFSQFINWIRVEGGGRFTQLNKSRWQITGTENGGRLQYEVFADNPGPYGAQLDFHHAFFNLAEILCYIDDERASPADVEFNDVPTGWKIATPLKQEGNVFWANNYDQLVDSPVEISNFDERDFDSGSAIYRVIVDSDGASAILDKIIPSLKRIVAAETSWMNDTPFRSYMFIYHFSDLPGDGGMEHAYGTAITLPTLDITRNFPRFLEITAHEFFHLWNVKRIRPQSLEPIDYTKEDYTPALWFSEGVDSTVSEYMLLRAGLLDEHSYLDHLGQELTELEIRTAHTTQSVEQSSIDAWLEKYPHYNLPARSISYYNKGELLGVLLDLKMREATGDHVSLRDLFQWMNQRYAKNGKFFADSAAVRDTARTLTNADFDEFFQKYVSGVDEIPWGVFFSGVGLEVDTNEVTFADPGFQAERNFDQPPTVVEVDAGSAAERAGLKSGDVIAQINNQRAGRDFAKVLSEIIPGSTVHLRIIREAMQRDLQWTVGSRQQKVYRLRDVSDLTARQRSRRAAWLFSDSASSK